MNYDISITSIISDYWLATPLLLAFFILAIAYIKKASDLLPRIIFMLSLTLLLLNPVVVKEIREYLTSKVIVVVDRSESMNIATRSELADNVVKDLTLQMTDKELVVIDGDEQNSNLFATLLSKMNITALNRVVGAVFVTDGQVHDAPKELKAFKSVMPINTIIIGDKSEYDYKVAVTQAPKYGLVGDKILIKIKAEREGFKVAADETANLVIEKDGEVFQKQPIYIGDELKFEFEIDHAGQNIFEFAIEEKEGEITSINNRAAVIVNGVRDRLKILLVSGKPHMGERAWRNLLRSDPAVDLVHFTILRSPRSFDLTPSNELSLISFPVRELFETKINDFDLIIFDKYVHYGMLRQRYFTNIAKYVENGGSFLFEMASDRLEPAVFDSDIAGILPVNGRISQQGIVKERYVPKLSEIGKYHAITSELELEAKGVTKWSSQVSLKQERGDLLLNGMRNNPLLIVDKVKEGRVALLASDNIWLWSKYPTTKGLYIELQRKLAHWLMKEPELEEGYIKVTREAGVFNIAQRYSKDPSYKIDVELPNGDMKEVTLKRDAAWLRGDLEITTNGIYKFSNDNGKALAVVGAADNIEFASIIATEKEMKKVASKTEGSVIWVNDNNSLKARKLNFSNKRAFETVGVDKINLFSPWLYIAILLAGFIYLWRKESY